MALFDMRCSNCGEVKKNVFLPLDHTEEDHPECCRMLMRKYWTKMPLAYDRDYTLEQPFAAAHDGTVITTRKENRDYMRRHGLLDANEVYEKPTYQSEQRERAEGQAAIDAITPSEDDMMMLKDVGIVDADGQLIPEN